jgi:hypothetical protein
MNISRILFWLVFFVFVTSVIWTGYYHFFGAGYFRPILITEKKIIDLGNVSADRPAETEFVVSNGGFRSLRIERVRSGCSGCVEIISYPKEPLKRNESAVIRVALQTESVSGFVRKSIMIVSNDPRRHSCPILIDAAIEAK